MPKKVIDSQSDKDKRLVTGKDVAEVSGVSQSLVSLILSGKPGKKIKQETRDKVLKTAQKMGYHTNMQASAMKRKRAGAIGILSVWDTGSFVFPPIVNGLKTICDKENLALTICTGKPDAFGSPDYLSYFLQNRLDGIIYLSSVGIGHEGVIENLQKHDVPFVCAIGAKDLPDVSSVDVNFIENGYLAAEHLCSRGCKHIFISIDETVNYAEKERYEGFLKGCKDAGVEPIQISCCHDGDNRATRLQLIDLLKHYPDMDGFAAVTGIAWQMLEAAREIGKEVPEDLKVISLDNDIYAPFVFPSLSTIDEPLEKIGEVAGEILVRKLYAEEKTIVKRRDEQSGDTKQIKYELSPTLSKRDSS